MITRSESATDTAPAVNVDFILLPHFSLLTFTAAADALTTANLVTGQARFTFRTVALQEPAVVSDLGIKLPVDVVVASRRHTPASSERGVSIVLVCGGYRCVLQENPQLSDWLRMQDHQGSLVGGLWNGIIAVARAGLMSGHACALHPDNHAQASIEHPDMLLRPETLVLDRRRLSAAGPSSAFELMLMLIGRHDSADTVHAIRQILKADTAPAAGRRQPRRHLAQEELPDNLQSALRLMRNNLDEPVSKKVLAQHINLSVRAMERLFQRHLETSPARYYHELRLQRAHELLMHGDMPVGEISDMCGFVSSAHFSRSFHRRYAMAPSAVRRSTSALLDT